MATLANDDPFDPSPPAEEDGDASHPGGIGHGRTREAIREHGPGLARIYAGSWLRTAGWAAETSLKIGSGLARAMVGGEAPTKALEDAAGDVRDAARRFLGIGGGDSGSTGSDNGRSSSEQALREQGAALLRHSADVGFDEDIHPAYERILGDITPDEARMLRLFVARGPRPAVDIRTFGPFGLGSDLVAQGLNMIGAEAGCRHTERVPQYLNNLNRLGLIWFSRDTLDEIQDYQVIEAQPEATEALKEAGRGAQTVRRSIHLTAFGGDFCDSVLPVDTAEFEAVQAEPVDLEGDAAAGPADDGRAGDADVSDGQ
jgi:hypothetical protein